LLPSFPPAVLALADGTIFLGFSIGAHGETAGEVVFNTALTGYQEIITDPSYSRQIITLTYPAHWQRGCKYSRCGIRSNSCCCFFGNQRLTKTGIQFSL
jgi:carbamoylphosphate synthase small subunit